MAGLTPGGPAHGIHYHGPTKTITLQPGSHIQGGWEIPPDWTVIVAADSNRQESKCSSPPMPSSASPADRRDQEVRAPAETPPSHGGLGQGVFKPRITRWSRRWVVRVRPYIDGGPVLCGSFGDACLVAKQLKEMWDAWP